MASNLGGYAGRVLAIDVTTREAREYPWSDQERALFLGGKIMAAKILYDLIEPGADPYGPENVLVISTGPLSGTGAPSSSRFNVSAISPLTGLLASSNCGGNFGLSLKKAGYDAIVVSGKSETPLRIEITEDAVRFHDAADLWGMKTGPVQEALETLSPKAGRVVIGPAGENLVRYAAIISNERAAGRAGLGAVMGAKKIKAITAFGNRKMTPHNPDATAKVYKSWVKQLKAHPLTGDALPKYGTGFLMRHMQRQSMLATHNFKQGRYADFDKVSGHTLAETLLVKNGGCMTCPIKCGRVVEVNGRHVKGPELETLGLLGPNLENNDLQMILDLNYLLDELGMDTMSTGGTLGFAMELAEQGLWDSGLKFGKNDNLAQVIEDIAHRRGIGDLLAEGTRRLAEKFGGAEFAIHVKGLELAAYEPRSAVGQGLGYATANRGGCHLNAGYLALMEGLGLRLNPHTPMAKAELTVLNQNLMEAVSGAGCCFFPLFLFYPGWLIRNQENPIAKLVNAIVPLTGASVNLMNKLPAGFLGLHLPTFPYTKALTAVTGLKIRMGEMRDMGERGYNLERLVNIRMGLTTDQDTLPKRLTDVPQDPNNPRSRVPLEKLKPAYYRIRGWNQSGVPTEAKLRKLLLKP